MINKRLKYENFTLGYNECCGRPMKNWWACLLADLDQTIIPEHFLRPPEGSPLYERACIFCHWNDQAQRLLMAPPVTFEVEMTAYQKGVIREVRVPFEELDGNKWHELEKIFYYGQNDFQPVKGRYSVSVGDVVRYHGQRYRVEPMGFINVTPE